MQHGSSLVSGETKYSPHSIEPWVVRIVENCWSSANLCLLTFQRWEKDLGIPRRSWLTDGTPLCGCARATSQTSIRFELTKSCVREKRTTTRRAQLVRRKPPSRCRNTKDTTEAENDNCGHPRQQLNLSLFPMHHKKYPRITGGRRRNTGRASGHKRNRVLSSGRSEKRTETQENVSVKKRVMMKSPKRPATHVSPPDEPLKRILLKKTDLKSDDVLMPVEIEDTDLLCCKR